MPQSARPTENSAARGAEGNAAGGGPGRLRADDHVSREKSRSDYRGFTHDELHADALNSYAEALRAIGETVRAGAVLPPLHSHLFHPRRRWGSR